MAIVNVQDWARVNSSGTETALAYLADCTVGNFLIAAIGMGDLGDDVTSVTDSLGNTWLKAVSIEVSGSSVAIAIFYCESCVSTGPNEVTAHFSAGQGNTRLCIAEFSGLATSSTLDQVNSGTATGTAVDSGDVTTTQDDELLVGASIAIVDGLSYTPSTDWTEQTDSAGFSSFHVQDRIVSATLTDASDPTLSSSSAWAAVVATFKAAVGGGGGGTLMWSNPPRTLTKPLRPAIFTPGIAR